MPVDTIRRRAPHSTPTSHTRAEARKFVSPEFTLRFLGGFTSGSFLLLGLFFLSTQASAMISKSQGGASSHSGHNTQQPVALTNGLVGWYAFDGDAKDVSGNGNNASISTGSPSYVSGKIGRALRFKATDGAYQANAYTSTYTAGVTVSLWTRTNYNGGSGVCSNYFSQQSAGKYLNISSNGGSFRWEFNHGGGDSPASDVYSSGGYANGSWVYVTGTYNPTSGFAALYVNGLVASSGTYLTGSTTTNSSTVNLGGGDGCSSVVLKDIDDLRIYSRALSAPEVATLYQGTNPTNCDQTCAGWWKMDENSGTSAIDSTGKGNTGTYSGSPTITSGVFGNGYLFNGTSQYITVPDSAATNFGTGDFTLGTWFSTASSPGGATNKGLVQKDNSATAGNGSQTSYNLFMSPAGFIGLSDYVAGTGVNIITPTSYADGQWHYAVGTRQGSTIKMYVDGKLITASSGGPMGSVTSTAPLVIGGIYNNATNDFAGSLDDARIYSRALADYEIFEQYSAGRS